MPSKVAFDSEEPCLGRIQADSVAPPHSPASIKQCISRIEKTPALTHADLFADISCDTPLKEGHISVLLTDGPGLSPNKPMGIVQMPIVQVESPSFPDGRYIIKNRAADIFWSTDQDPMKKVNLLTSESTMALVKNSNFYYSHVSEHSPIISSVQKITFLRSGTSHMILMIISS
jgi:hypothetical protein